MRGGRMLHTPRKMDLPRSLMNASGCGVQVKEYGHLLARDPKYAAQGAANQRNDERSCRVPAAVRCRAANKDRSRRHATRSSFIRRARCNTGSRFAAPSKTCSHHLALRSRRSPKATCAAARPERTRCCNPSSPTQLRDRKLGHLQAAAPDVILSANIGCITHLATGTTTRVMHWIEWLDERLQRAT